MMHQISLIEIWSETFCFNILSTTKNFGEFNKKYLNYGRPIHILVMARMLDEEN